ncbi:hypothetical protein QVH35_03170 [Candidatus Nitrosotenuis chungbukensis]|uniref:hypothetical protein n=1 Tax=Candidatus Nitrosotenuis chungbukensis TaxID=1353246 RepID=UPI000694CA38|nr:hypothetical protein [Candidatus Nitrosotenuis chungbukensis]WKT58429.1 hypothetical protein QVH35_03170 [Candidatus Nitrosotenuis chungbukensis]
MLLKLVVISAILIVGGFSLYPYLAKLPSSANIAFNAVADDVGDFKDNTIRKVSGTIDQTVDTVENKIDTMTPSADDLNPVKQIQDMVISPKQQTYYGQVYEKDEEQQKCKISIPQMAKTVNGKKELTHTIDLENCKFQKQEPVQVTETTNPVNAEAIAVESLPQSKIFETLQLKTVRHDDNTISIQYEDTSGKTVKVTVTLRNSEKQLFVGEFFSSKFDTNVNDISSSPHIIEMVVEHPDYGTVSSSVYNPQGDQDTAIYGVFTQPPS